MRLWIWSIRELERFPKDKRKKLNSRIAPAPARAKELREFFARFENGNVLGLVKDIWPSLVEVIVDGTASYAIYADIIRDNMMHVKYSNDFLASEEGFIARAVPHTDQAKTVMAHELVQGGEYRVIVSGYSGLYRYCTNVLVRCEEITDRPVTVITEESVYKAVKLFVRKTDIKDEQDKYCLVLDPADFDDNFSTACAARS